MKKQIKRPFAILTSLCIIGSLSGTLSSCGEATSGFKNGVLRVASWDEYIDLGGEDSYAGEDSRPIYEEFEDWYYEQTGKKITVEYIPLQDNETMYNKIKMGDKYDLLCPSEYMILKLKEENKLEKLPETFFDASIETNYYAQNRSDYIQEIFETNGFEEYAAGYMWGTTGFVYNADKIDREDVSTWEAFVNPEFKKDLTAKDNVRDSYFVGLGLYYEEELNSLKLDLENGTISDEEYEKTLSEKMNDTSEETVNNVKEKLIKMRSNLYGLETDEGKTDVMMGRIGISYQWSGDAVYIIDEAANNGFNYEYSIPKSASNLWFDGWTMMKGANVDAATAFINYVSRPDNVVRNMDYIGYTSCCTGFDNSEDGPIDEVFEYLKESYETDEETELVDYDLSYFFDPNNKTGIDYVLSVPEEETLGMLFAQYPDAETIKHCVVMKCFDKDSNYRVTRMWTQIK